MPRFGFVRLMNENHGVLGFNLGHLWDEMARLRTYLEKVLDHYREGHVRPVIAGRPADCVNPSGRNPSHHRPLNASPGSP